jgi:hypothetical protein
LSRSNFYGMNLAGGKSYDCTSLIYNDLMRQASGLSFSGSGAAVDAHGWPTKVDATTGGAVSIVALNAFLPAGDYQLRADGIGQVAIGGGFVGGGPGSDSNWCLFDFDGSGPGTTRVVTWPKAGFPFFLQTPLQIRSSDPANPLRNIQLLLPGSSGKFYEGFLANVAPFDALRFMDWGNTNSNPIVEWAELTASPYFSVAYLPAIPYEDWIELCNLTGKHPWINIPALASDDFIVRMASLFDSTLDPDLTIIVEFSNELWNPGMGQWGQLLGKRPAGSNEGDWQFIARLDGHATNLFKASVKPGRKCLRMLARQAGYQATLQVAQQIYKENNYGYDVIGAAAYFVTNADMTAATARFQSDPAGAIAAVLDGCDASIATVAGPDQLGWYKQQADLAGVPLAIYEAGQSLGGSDASTPLIGACNRDPRMGQKYLELAAALPPGIGPVCWYSDTGAITKFGAWGAKEYTDQPDSAAPKWQAILQLARESQVTRTIGDDIAAVQAAQKQADSDVAAVEAAQAAANAAVSAAQVAASASAAALKAAKATLAADLAAEAVGPISGAFTVNADGSASAYLPSSKPDGYVVQTLAPSTTLVAPEAQSQALGASPKS